VETVVAKLRLSRRAEIE